MAASMDMDVSQARFSLLQANSCQFMFASVHPEGPAKGSQTNSAAVRRRSTA